MLWRYEERSKQKINFEKLALSFSSSATERTKSVWDTSHDKYGKYLGLPIMVGRNRRQMFKGLKSRIATSLNGWSKKSLSLRKMKCS